MKTLLKVGLAIALVAGFIVAGGCDDTGTGMRPGDGDASVSILLTDAPAAVEAAVVTITDIYLVSEADDDSSPADTTEASEDSAPSKGRIYLRQNNPVTTDLLTLSNDVFGLVDGVTVPAGRYSQLRFVISGGYLEVANGSSSTFYATSPSYDGLPAGVTATGELKCPSCSSSGFKVKLGNGNVDLSDGENLTLLVDFDVSQSFGHQAGKSGKWIMKPVLKAVVETDASQIDVSLVAGDSLALPVIAGDTLDLGDFAATLTPAAGGDAKVVLFTDADADGKFTASFLHVLPGDYSVGVAGPDSVSVTTNPASPVTLTVVDGGDASASFTLLTATAPAAGTE